MGVWDEAMYPIVLVMESSAWYCNNWYWFFNFICVFQWWNIWHKLCLKSDNFCTVLCLWQHKFGGNHHVEFSHNSRVRRLWFQIINNMCFFAGHNSSFNQIIFNQYLKSCCCCCLLLFLWIVEVFFLLDPFIFNFPYTTPLSYGVPGFAFIH